jgi:hypothetical protein
MLAIESNDKRHDRKRCVEKQQMLNAEPRDRHVAS